MKKTLFFALTFSFPLFICAQERHFITEGEIVFEKTVNMYPVLKRSIDSGNENRMAAYEQYKSTQPQFLALKSKLFFSKKNTAYIPEPNTVGIGLSYFGFNPIYSQINKVFNQPFGDSTIVQKDILNELFLIKDKKRNIKWKITDEVREIAGFTCRRANGLVNDSIYVVAFYSNKIPIPTGPESFYGLPGMILGIALPHENVSWFATQVIEKRNEPNVFALPTKGKIVTNKELEQTLRSTLKSIGSNSNSVLISCLL